MIREFSVTNFRSINDKQTISFVRKSPYKLGEGTHYVTMPDGTDLLRFIALYGPNASGKSNIIKAFIFIINFLVSDRKRNFKEPINGVSLFKFGKDNKFSSFAIDFYTPDGNGSQARYIYELELNEVFVKRESVLYYSSQKPTKIFERIQKDERSEPRIQFGTGFKVSENLMQRFREECSPNISFLTFLRFIKCPFVELQNVIDYFDKLQIPVFDMTIDSLFQNDEKKNFVLNALSQIDINIKDIKVLKTIIPPELLAQVPEELRHQISNIKYVSLFECNVNGVNETFDASEISNGTINAIRFVLSLYEMRKKNYGLIISDEFETCYHPDVMIKLVSEFLHQENTFSQLFITTHCYDILDMLDPDEQQLRYDNINFVEKDNSGKSILYSLAKCKNLGKVSSFRKAYKNRKFGANPNVYMDESFYEDYTRNQKEGLSESDLREALDLLDNLG